MWVFVLSRKITGAFTVEQELNALNADFPKNVFKHVGKTRALVMVPVEDPMVDEIQLLADNPNLIPGSAKLSWFQEDLREDILRTIEENEVKEKPTDDLKAEVMRGFADLLGSMGQLRGFASRMPEDLKQQMRDHAKKCTDPDCGVNRLLAEEDKGAIGSVPVKVGDKVTWRDGASHVWTGTAIKPFPAKTPFTELPPGAARLTDDLSNGVNRLCEYSYHDRFIVEVVEDGEVIYKAPRVDMLKVVSDAAPDSPQQP
jgi:hypothetical protein